jgi:DNA polymerase-3 subunit chi
VIVDFYHLKVSPLENVLPRICERLLAEGERVLILADAHLLDELDEQLWSCARDSFLPHAQAGNGTEDRQPILLSSGVDQSNRARNVAIADGKWRDEALTADRVFFLFDDTQVEGARPAWSLLKQREDIERRYWKQDMQGKWVQGP